MRDDKGWVRVLFWALVGVGAVTAGATLLLRDQTERHRRDLFHAHPLRRLAALHYVRTHPGVENVLLLRDYLAWEPRPLLRRRAALILERMERRIAEGGGPEAAALA
ncbi:MAG: hypothetical protein ACREKI_09120 [Gemmatimonadota bacterium]